MEENRSLLINDDQGQLNVIPICIQVEEEIYPDSKRERFIKHSNFLDLFDENHPSIEYEGKHYSIKFNFRDDRNGVRTDLKKN